MQKNKITIKTASPLKKIRQLTTSLGVYQFGKGNKPDPSFGYALDDQARALIIADEFKEESLKRIYLQYIIRSQRSDGLLFQFSDKKGKFEDNTSIEKTLLCQDAYGETVWALLKTGVSEQFVFKKVFERLLNSIEMREFLRPRAYSLIGLSILKYPTSHEKKITNFLVNLFYKNYHINWQWFENYLAYANAILPWACWEISLSRRDKEMEKIADITTKFLIDKCQVKGIPAPIGNQGRYKKDGEKALFDQQPIDAAYMVCCLEKAYQVTRNQLYLSWAKKWWQWFFGNNLNKISLVDENFACYDGLTPNGANKNQGAESNICFLMAWLAAQKLGL